MTSLDPRSRLRTLLILFAATFVTLAGFFMLMPLLVLRLHEQGLGPTEIGLFSATMWLGVLLVAPWADRCVALLGRRRAFVLTALTPALGGAGFLLTDSLWLWALLMLLDGLSAGLRWVLAEATVAEAAAPERRGLMVGLYETMVGATFVLGPVLLQFTGTEGQAGLWVSALLCILGLLLVLALPPLGRPQASPHGSGPGALWRSARAMPSILALGFVGGFFESGLTGLLPLMGLGLGWAAATAALLVAASGLGSALCMTPAGWLTDRLGLPAITRACALLTLAGCLALPWAAQWPALAWPIAFVWGGAGGALYTLVMIDLGHRLQGQALLQGTGVLVLAYTAGAMLAGPTGGLALSLGGGWGLSLWLAAVAAFGLWAIAAQSAEPACAALKKTAPAGAV